MIDYVVPQIKKIKADPMVVGTLIMTVGTFIGSVLNYSLQFISGRLLSLEDFGTFNSILSLSMLLLIPANVIGFSAIKKVASLKAGKDYKALTQLFIWLNVLMITIGTIIFFGLNFFSKNIFNYLQISESDSSLMVVFSLFIFFSLINAIPAAYLQGLLRYKGFAFYTALTAVFRVGLAIVSLLMGYKVFGIFGAYVVSILISITLGYFILKKNLDPDFKNESNTKKHLRQLLFFGISVLFVRVGMNLLNNVDIILVKHLFSGNDAGLYAGVVNVGKLILFGAGLLSSALFPIISNAYSGKKNYFGYFFGFFGLQVFVVLCSVIFFSLFPGMITKIMFGEKFLPSAPLLPLFAVFIGCYVLVNVCTTFLLAIEKSKVWILLLVGGASQYFLIHNYHDSLFEVVKVNIFVILSILVFLLWYIFIQWRQYVSSENSS